MGNNIQTNIQDKNLVGQFADQQFDQPQQQESKETKKDSYVGVGSMRGGGIPVASMGMGMPILLLAAGCSLFKKEEVYPLDPDNDDSPWTEDCDNEDPNVQVPEWYADADGDGYGDIEDVVLNCDQPEGYVDNDLDCDDNDATLNPDTEWYLDNDMDGYGNPNVVEFDCEQPSGYVDNDGDGDDMDNTVYPGATEYCDGKDNDLNGQIDDNAVDTKVWYLDDDSDDFGVDTDVMEACDQPSGYAEVDGDCDDAQAAINPDATEICDEIDNNCDENVDEGVTTTYYYDEDGDNFGVTDLAMEACSLPADHALVGGDCDDTNPYINPDAVEICDEIDNNCIDGIDEGLTTRYYLDDDQDLYGLTSDFVDACSWPLGYSDVDGDCDDTDPYINPDAVEVCDGVDNNCVDGIDEGVTTTYYLDSDADLYGLISDTIEACELPEGYAEVDGDCDDTNPDINPDAVEVCDEVDNNCVDGIDEGVQTTYYLDNDGDLYGLTDDTTEACEVPGGYAEVDGDCDDTNPDIYPGAEDFSFDGVDAACELDFEQVDSSIASAEITANSNDALGYSPSSLANIGDVNGDGFDDLGVGVEFSNYSATDGGLTAVFYGGLALGASTSVYDADVLFSDATGNAYAGSALVGLGDMNADSYDDFAVIARGAGSVYVVQGGASLSDDTFDSAATATISGIDPFSIAAGDHNGDGIPDLVVGDKTASKVYVFEGPVSGALTAADADVQLDAGSSDALGSAILMHDWNGDGNADLVAAAEEFDGVPGADTGRVCVELGPLASGTICSSSHFMVDGDASLDYIGQTLQILPDIDTDGYDELVVGAGLKGPFVDGEAYVFSGSDVVSGGTTTTATAFASYTEPYDGLGLSAATGDLDADGLGDICLGAYSNDDAGLDAGKVDCLVGGGLSAGSFDLTVDPVTSRISGSIGDFFGKSLLMMDLDGDGVIELYAGAPNANSNDGAVLMFDNNF